jgi:hypothetical protein
MAIQIVLPFGKKGSVKNIVFSILSREYPLKLIEIKKYVEKQYGKAVTFQAIRKSVIELVNDGVLQKENQKYQIQKAWVLETKKSIDLLYSQLNAGNKNLKKFDSLGDEISVFSFDSIGELMKFWENLIDDWLKRMDVKELPINCYQTSHLWEVLMYPEVEKKIMSQFQKSGIQAHILCTSNTPLDRIAAAFYRKIGVRVSFNPSSSIFDKEYSVGTYGDLTVQTRYPENLWKQLDLFFRKTRTLEEIDLGVLSELVQAKTEIKLLVSKNKDLAKQINHSIITQMD